MGAERIRKLYERRTSHKWRHRLYRLMRPPDPFVMNPAEPVDAPLGRWNLYIGGAGCSVPGYVNVDLFAMPGVDVTASAEQLPFRSAMFTRLSVMQS
jgi:hypothetical protein